METSDPFTLASLSAVESTTSQDEEIRAVIAVLHTIKTMFDAEPGLAEKVQSKLMAKKEQAAKQAAVAADEATQSSIFADTMSSIRDMIASMPSNLSFAASVHSGDLTGGLFDEESAAVASEREVASTAEDMSTEEEASTKEVEQEEEASTKEVEQEEEVAEQEEPVVVGEEAVLGDHEVIITEEEQTLVTEKTSTTETSDMSNKEPRDEGTETVMSSSAISVEPSVTSQVLSEVISDVFSEAEEVVGDRGVEVASRERTVVTGETVENSSIVTAEDVREEAESDPVPQIEATLSVASQQHREAIQSSVDELVLTLSKSFPASETNNQALSVTVSEATEQVGNLNCTGSHLSSTMSPTSPTGTSSVGALKDLQKIASTASDVKTSDAEFVLSTIRGLRSMMSTRPRLTKAISTSYSHTEAVVGSTSTAAAQATTASTE